MYVNKASGNVRKKYYVQHKALKPKVLVTIFTFSLFSVYRKIMPLVRRQSARMSCGGRSPSTPKGKAVVTPSKPKGKAVTPKGKATTPSAKAEPATPTRRQSTRLSGKGTTDTTTTSTGTTSPHFKKASASGSRKRALPDSEEDKEEKE